MRVWQLTTIAGVVFVGALQTGHISQQRLVQVGMLPALLYTNYILPLEPPAYRHTPPVIGGTPPLPNVIGGTPSLPKKPLPAPRVLHPAAGTTGSGLY